jgi:LacI family repressor for deo operon, udp, cdd, tsx, nupC, and nupG
LGIDVPAEVSVVGFDDLPMAEYTTPSLTTVHMPIAQMAAAGVKAAVEEQGGADAVTLRIIKPDITIRNSSGPAPSATR